MNAPVQDVLFLSAFLFCAGLFIIIVKRNTIMILLGIELMLNAANLNLVAYNTVHADRLDGQMFSLFVIIVAVCEAAVGLAIVLSVYKNYKTSIPDQVNELKDYK
jgi:NADH:ubiquinone oxidoreductase subunit K